MECDESIPEDETLQDVPEILSPQLYDIFPMFASMLDIKSFMKLAMTSKQMYKRCMEDKSIIINVDEHCISAYSVDQLRLSSSVVSRHIKSYITALGSQRCRVNLRTLRLYGNEEASMSAAACLYLTGMNVKRVEKLVIHQKFSEWEAIIPFIKVFHVNCLRISDAASELSGSNLRLLLQQNLKEFYYERSIPVDILFEMDSPILKLSLTGIRDIPDEKFMHILWMIQSGSLHHITVGVNAVDWSAYNTLPINWKQKLPEDRPLVFTARPRYTRVRIYWFLHWQGGVTKCIRDEGSRTLEVFKCEPNDFPLVLRKDEDILKDLREMRSEVSCNPIQFRSFAASFTMFGPSFRGTLPADRPLYFKVSEKSFWCLDESDNLNHFYWKDGSATCKRFILKDVERIDHPALAKFRFWKFLKDDAISPRHFHCEFASSWFMDFKMLDFNYTGPLPEERPLVFRGRSPKIWDVLLDGFRFQCSFNDCGESLTVHRFSTWERPTNPITAEIVKQMLQDTSKCFGNAYVNIPVDLNTFRDGFDLFESTPCAFGPFAWRKMQECNEQLIEECWYYANEAFMKVVWDEGRLVRTPCDPRDFPMEFMKILFKEFARQGECSIVPIFLELEQVKSCLEQFAVAPFDYSGQLKIDFPLAIMKNEIRHTSDHVIYVWFIWEDMKTTYCSWGEKEEHEVLFFNSPDCVVYFPIPPALKTKEYLKMLLELRYEENTECQWFGDFDYFLAYFNEYKTFPFNYTRKLPEERPLVFEDNRKEQEPVRILFREDNSMVKCKWSASARGVARLCHPRGKKIAPALRKYI